MSTDGPVIIEGSLVGAKATEGASMSGAASRAGRVGG